MTGSVRLFGLLPLHTDPAQIGAALTHDRTILALSIVIALATAYAFLEVAAAAKARREGPGLAWRAGAGLVLGLGVWATHFCALLALNSPLVTGVSPTIGAITALALAVAAPAMMMIAAPKSGWRRYALGGILFATAAQGAHYADLLALPMDADLSFRLPWIAAAGVVALAAATLAAPLAYALATPGQRLLSTLPMAAVMAGLHHVGIAAAVATPEARFEAPSGGVNHLGLALGIAAFAILVAALAIMVGRLAPRTLPHENEPGPQRPPVEVTGDPIVILPRKNPAPPGQSAP
jgi:NO-binding membrane sensor protein with MHYT domain